MFRPRRFKKQMEKAMKILQYPSYSKKFLQFILLLAIMLFNFSPATIRPVYATGPTPPNDTWQNAAALSIPSSISLDTTGAAKEVDEPEADLAHGGCEGRPLRKGVATVWYTYTNATMANKYISLDTLGSTQTAENPITHEIYDYDTYIAVWTGSPPATLIACNNNNDAGFQSQLGFTAVPSTTYYIEVAEYDGWLDDATYNNPGYNGGSLQFHVGDGLTITGNAGIASAKITYNGGSTFADGSGNYTLALPTNFSGTVTPSRTGYLFAPAVRGYNNIAVNQTAQNYNLYSVSPADFNGDGMTDVAVFRPSQGIWYVSGQGSTAFGQAGDIPVPADYNGDGKDERAVFRPSNSLWYISGQAAIAYGTTGDIPVVADYNGDGMADIAVFRQSNSTWYIRGQGTFAYGTVGDIPVVADYNGDGKADIAVFRPTNSTWYLYGIGPRVYGTVGDIPVIADYDGDGKADIAVFRPTNSTWYLYGIGPRLYGTVGDVPAIGDYNGDGKADITVFRPTNSTWYKYGVGPSVYGTVGDIPV
jgi:uncharacterized protein YhfF